MIRVIFDLSDANMNEQLLAERLMEDVALTASEKTIRVMVIKPQSLEKAIHGDQSLPSPLEQNPQTISSAPKFPQLNGVVDRIDFISADARCHVCQRPLTSGSAYIIKSDDGSEHPCGPTCVTKVVPDLNLQQFPDFTRAAKTLPGEERQEERMRSDDRQVSPPPEEEYLRLRYEQLNGFNIPSFTPLDEIYGRFKKDGLSAKDREFIKHLLEKMPNSKLPGLSLENLQACYAYHFWLAKAIDLLPADKRDYLAKLLEDLKKKFYLSEKQVDAANNWLRKMEGMPVLDPAPFSWALKK